MKRIWEIKVEVEVEKFSEGKISWEEMVIKTEEGTNLGSAGNGQM